MTMGMKLSTDSFKLQYHIWFCSLSSGCPKGTYGPYCRRKCKCLIGGSCDTMIGACDCLLASSGLTAVKVSHSIYYEFDILNQSFKELHLDSTCFCIYFTEWFTAVTGVNSRLRSTSGRNLIESWSQWRQPGGPLVTTSLAPATLDSSQDKKLCLARSEQTGDSYVHTVKFIVQISTISFILSNFPAQN